MPRNHDAKDCPNERQCARCAKDHDTKDCQVQDTKDFFCANCGTAGHGAASRECPHMLKIADDMAKRQVDAGYRYFPTRNPTTWTKLETQDAPARAATQQRGAFPVYRPHHARVEQLLRQPSGYQRGRPQQRKLTATNNTPLGTKKAQYVFEHPRGTLAGNQERALNSQ
ncbi:hypothetical protein CPB85DRAFT_1403763, partial [Mucidula mucida]